MNHPPETFKRISADQLRTFGTTLMQTAGMPADHAELLATLLTNASLRGVHWGGAFVGQNNARAKELGEKWPAARNGGFIIVMKLDLFVPEAEFRTGVDDLIQSVRENMLPVTGYPEATLPGTPEAKREQDGLENGAIIPLDHVEQLEETAREFGIQPPWQL